tara:strand:- start:261 stop:389 length:129 start_codon:yes stop_codon:yes gene_type:complete
MGDTIYSYAGIRWQPCPEDWEELTEEECWEILGLLDERGELI